MGENFRAGATVWLSGCLSRDEELIKLSDPRLPPSLIQPAPSTRPARFFSAESVRSSPSKGFESNSHAPWPNHPIKCYAADDIEVFLPADIYGLHLHPVEHRTSVQVLYPSGPLASQFRDFIFEQLERSDLAIGLQGDGFHIPIRTKTLSALFLSTGKRLSVAKSPTSATSFGHSLVQVNSSSFSSISSILTPSFRLIDQSLQSCPSTLLKSMSSDRSMSPSQGRSRFRRTKTASICGNTSSSRSRSDSDSDSDGSADASEDLSDSFYTSLHLPLERAERKHRAQTVSM